MTRQTLLKRVGLVLAGLLVFLMASGALLVRCLNYFPRSLERAPVWCAGAPKTLRVGQRFSLLSWNLQFGAGRSYHFFYDGGGDVHASRSKVERTLSQIGALLSEQSPDLVLLQEVDRDSARTTRLDELDRLRGLNLWSCWTSTPYHRSRYVPVPLREPLGRVDMHLATGSRFRMAWARRHALPLLDEWFWRRAFNLKRAILETAVPLSGFSRPLVLLNTHLSAFSHGDGTLSRQVDVIMARLKRLDEGGYPWILAGDFNMLPPGESGRRLGDEAKYYSGARSPMARLFRRYRTAVSAKAYAADPSRHYTYIKFGAKEPDRRIDYIFVSAMVRVFDVRVLHPHPYPSDHLPLLLIASVSPPDGLGGAAEVEEKGEGVQGTP